MWLLFGICVVLFGLAVLIFGDSPSFRNSWVQSTRRYLLKVNSILLNKLNALDHPILGWLVPLFYLFVISFCFYEFFTQSWLVLPKSVKFSLFHQLTIFLSISTVYSLTFICIFSNPGYIHKLNVGDVNYKFQNNGIIFFDGNACKTCEFPKPARSKHCSSCDRCIMLFDHHCIWINNCVGYYNYKYFIAWLLSNLQFMCYGNYLLCQAIPPLQVMKYVKISEPYKISGVFILLCSIFSVIVVVFTGLQARYIYLGVTTNEVDKWSEIEHLIRIGALVKRQGVYYEVVDNQMINLQNTRLFPIFQDVIRVTSVEEIDNIYDKGFNGNFYEKMFPDNLG